MTIDYLWSAALQADQFVGLGIYASSCAGRSLCVRPFLIVACTLGQDEDRSH